MKERFNIIDIIAVVNDIRKQCLGLRLANFYDIDNKNYLIRLGTGENRRTIIIEYGKRLYITNYTWTKNLFPSPFSMKCRKTIGNKRLTDVRIIGLDRVMDMQFGIEPHIFHLICEIYDKGNLVLTDVNYSILQSCRIRKVNDEIIMKPNQIYDISKLRTYRKPTVEEISNTITQAPEKTNIKKYLSSEYYQYGSNIIEHFLSLNGFSKKSNFGQNLTSEDKEKLIKTILECDNLLNDFLVGNLSGGYIFLNEEPSNDSQKATYNDYQPIILNYLNDQKYKYFEHFSEAVDEYYSQIILQKVDVQLQNREKAAQEKVENVKKDHDTRLNSLESEQNLFNEIAQLITLNHEQVDDAIYLINSCLAGHMNWNEINQYLDEAKSEYDPIAAIIDYTKFDTNEIAVLLQNEDKQTKSVLVNLSMGAFANSKEYYSNRRGMINKIDRTVASQSKALISAQSKMKQVLKENEIKVKIKKNRKVNWFEKFRWFISSDNYLVLAGRDAMENEVLVKRHTTKYDIFVHAELHGSASVIIKVQKDQVKENSKLPVPLKTLNEAGAFAVCCSSAWENHVTVAAYWVKMEQVSKTAPTGEYLSVGGFLIRGTKNFLPIPTLVLGIGILFKIDHQIPHNHLNDRIPKWTEEMEINDEVVDENEESFHESESSEEESKIDSNLLTKIIQETTKPSIEQKKEPKNKVADQNEMKEFEKIENNGEKESTVDSKTSAPSQFKRGQKSRYKIKKQKYADQDEEDRQLAENLLHVSFKPQTSKKKIKLQNQREKEAKKDEIKKIKEKKNVPQKPPAELELDSEDSDTEKLTENNFLSSFISNPLPEDELLYSLMVVAPYSCLLPYKYKIKLIPGTTKRGKAIKTCISMFLSAQDSNEKEKILISSLKDVDNSRNVPALVKVSAPNMSFLKNKNKQK